MLVEISLVQDCQVGDMVPMVAYFIKNTITRD